MRSLLAFYALQLWEETEFSEEKDSGEWGGLLSDNPSEMNINILTIPFYAVLAADMPWSYSLINSTIGGEGRLMSSVVDNSLDDQRYISYNNHKIGADDYYYRTLSFSLRLAYFA